MITILILLVAIGILGWGFVRARSLGKLGILAWLQSVVLMLPWLLFFGLFAAGVYLNLAGALLLLLISTGLYIVLGRQLRLAAQDPALAEKLTANAPSDSPTSPSEPTVAEAQPIAQPEAIAPPASPPEAPAMPPDDLQAIRTIFGVDTFFSTEAIPYQNGMIFKGNLRGEAATVRDRLAASLEE
ncbi:MAG: site-2 protease family protein, partial [Microcoleus sp. SIO2G3]|nr:site-2 protease family protein [Microcoleus sp. SIO2G3]